MKETFIYDLNSYPNNLRNGMYGGLAGDKEGISIGKGNWIVKYPKSTRSMKGDLVSYTTAPLSEYLGSNIYQMLDIDVHETMLGIRNGKLVVACKDFCKNVGSLREMRTIKNIYNKELNKQLETSLTSTASSVHSVSLEDMLIHLKYNPLLKDVPEVTERFWQQFIVDVLINNSDRNNGNWGLLLENEEYRLAPVYDNGGSFSNKMLDTKIERYLSNESDLQQVINSSRTVYEVNGKSLFAKGILKIDNEDLYKVAISLVPVIKSKMEDIKVFIQNVPESCNGISVCSNARKDFYTKTMEMKLEQILLPLYEKSKTVLKETNYNKHSSPKKNNDSLEDR